MALFSSFGQTFFIALSTGPIRESYNLTSGEYGSLYMIATLASAMMLPFVGRLVDRFSIAVVAAGTIILLAAACGLLAIAQSIPLLLFALFALRLFGQGMMSHISLTAMGKWFFATRGKAVSIASLGFTVGQALMPMLFIVLLGYVTWRQGWLIAAAVLILVALPAIVLLVKTERNPQSFGDHAPETSTMRQWTRRDILRDPYFWLTCTGIMAPPFIGTAIFFHQDFILAERGWSYDTFAIGFLVLTVMGVISGLISGALIDRKSATALLPTSLIPLGLGCIVLGVGHAEMTLLVYMALIGISFGISGSVMGAIWPEIYGTENLGSIRSTVMSLMVLFSALGPGVIGWAIDFGVPLQTQLVGLGIYCLLAVLALVVSARKFMQRHIASQI
ncbi:MAG: MFS transporter [Rhodobacteraceae bacterium]|nr:MFS transporter [Paracoccaceae bacterium]